MNENITLSIYDIIQVIAFVMSFAGVYFKLNIRLAKLEENQKILERLIRDISKNSIIIPDK